MYDDLGLVDNFGECGKSRSAWRIGSISRARGKGNEALEYTVEAEEIRVRRGGDITKIGNSEKDFNALLNHMDS